MATGLEVMATLRQRLTVWWYRKRVAAADVVRPKVSPIRRVAPPLHMQQTAADLLDWLCQLHRANYTILRLNDGVVVLLELPDRSVVSSGLASSTFVAVEQLRKKLDA